MTLLAQDGPTFSSGIEVHLARIFLEKVASATFSKGLHEIFASISDGIVGKNFMRSVIFEAHVPENDGFSFDSVICG